MNWTHIKLAAVVTIMPAWVLYVLMTTPSSSSGYHVPSPDRSMSAKIMRIHKSPTIGAERTYYEISVYDEYSPAKVRQKPIIKEKYPLSVAPLEYELTRECIRWDMPNSTVIFDFGKTEVSKKWR